MTTYDQNGDVVCRDLRREPDGTWSVNVWWGSHIVTNVARQYYSSRQSARHADIGDDIGKYGRVG